MNIRAESASHVNAILEIIRESGHKPDLIPLSDYADEATFTFLLPGNGWTFAEWQAVNIEVARQLRAAGFNVRMVKLTLVEFMDWLVRYRLKNNPQNRAQFVAWKIAHDESKPDPLPD